jgi:transposase
LSETVYAGRSLEILKSQVENSSDLPTLLYMAKNGRLRERKKALTIVARKRGIPNAIISAILHSSRKTTRRYFTVYSEAGTSGLFGSRTQQSKTPADPGKTRHMLELLHQKPTAFGINRTSWTQRALIQAYKERYKQVISRCIVQRLIKNAGYSWRKARRVLTSPDPKYEEKVELLLRTLRSLGESELLFFLDEWGPVQVRKRGGKAYSAKYNVPRIPRPQTLKGTVTLVAALSATTNQMTWAFAKSKDTCSMTDLLEILYNQYQAHSKLYVTWDAVSWHNSTTLTDIDWLDRFNEETRRQVSGPIIELVPLPTSSQFLNVIEGVLSGMTRAVINNSDYGSSGDMKLAISRHFMDRNKHFEDNPRRAGKGIWEVELVHGSDAFTAAYEGR